MFSLLSLDEGNAVAHTKEFTCVTLTSCHLVIIRFLSRQKVLSADAPVSSVPIDRWGAFQPGQSTSTPTGHHPLFCLVQGRSQLQGNGTLVPQGGWALKGGYVVVCWDSCWHWWGRHRRAHREVSMVFFKATLCTEGGWILPWNIVLTWPQLQQVVQCLNVPLKIHGTCNFLTLPQSLCSSSRPSSSPPGLLGRGEKNRAEAHSKVLMSHPVGHAKGRHQAEVVQQERQRGLEREDRKSFELCP